MFRSKKRPLIIPQYEHGRMAGFLAQNWGNETFDRPALDFEAFVNGVTLHDWHYGFADNWSITDLDEDTWMMIAKMGVKMRLENPISDLVSKYHLRRLISYGPTSAERQNLTAQIEQIISERLSETNHERTAFEWADNITRFCDFVVFHFAFEAPFEGSTAVYQRNGSSKKTKITYHISGEGEITIHPWPYSLPTLSGIIIGYEALDYPENQKPLTIPFIIQPGV